MRRIKIPLCGCGCGQKVTKSKRKKGTWNKFLPGHNLKINLTEEEEEQRRNKISKSMKIYIENNPQAKKIRCNTWKGRKHTKESRKKMSEKSKGENNGMYGKTHTKEAKKKISNFWKGRKFSKQIIDKITKANKGKVRTKEQRKQISLSLKEYYKYNENPFKGKHHTEETKKKLKKALKGKYINEKASNWKGGVSSLPYSIEWNKWLREEIKERDNYNCQNPKCKNKSNILDVHHIDYNKNNNNKNNLITICKSCHGKTQRRRKYWIWYYKKLLKRINKKGEE